MRVSIAPEASLLICWRQGAMQIDPTPTQREFIQRAIADGRFQREEDAVQDALLLWEERERLRSEILAALDEAEADLSTGSFADYAQGSAQGLAEQIKAEARIHRPHS